MCSSDHAGSHGNQRYWPQDEPDWIDQWVLWLLTSRKVSRDLRVSHVAWMRINTCGVWLSGSVTLPIFTWWTRSVYWYRPPKLVKVIYDSFYIAQKLPGDITRCLPPTLVGSQGSEKISWHYCAKKCLQRTSRLIWFTKLEVASKGAWIYFQIDIKVLGCRAERAKFYWLGLIKEGKDQT